MRVQDMTYSSDEIQSHPNMGKRLTNIITHHEMGGIESVLEQVVDSFTRQLGQSIKIKNPIEDFVIVENGMKIVGISRAGYLSFISMHTMTVKNLTFPYAFEKIVANESENLVFIADSDRQIVAVRITDGVIEAKAECLSGPVDSLVFQPPNLLIASDCNGNISTLEWDGITIKQIKTVNVPVDQSSSFVLSPDGHYSISYDRTKGAVYSVQDNKAFTRNLSLIHI